MSPSAPSQPLSQQAYEQIKTKIIRLEMPPGSVVDEAQLQEELGLGRTPIREALKRLSWEKLATIVPRRGIFVSDVGYTDLQHLLELRIEMEGLAARLGARRGKAKDWAQMQSLIDQLSQVDEHDYDTLIDLDEQFHHALYAASRNEFLHDQLAVSYSLTKRLWYLVTGNNGEHDVSTVAHEQILAHLKAGRGEEASAELASHIQTLQNRMQPLILR